MYYTYMIRCKDDSIYTGITTDFKRRFCEHREKTKKCAKYTLVHDAIKIEALWQSESRVNASKLEYRIKKLTRLQKENLIKDNNIFSSYFYGIINESDYIRIKNIENFNN